MPPTDTARPTVLIVAPGDEVYRGYCLEQVAATYDVAVITQQSVTWEAGHVVDHELADPYQLDQLFAAGEAITARRTIEGVLTWNENLLVHTAQLAEHLGLRTNPAAVMENCRDKHATRQLLAIHQVPSARSGRVRDLLEATILAEDIGYPVVLKPAGQAGSVGVIRVDNSEVLARAFDFAAAGAALAGGQNSDVLVEEYLDGPETAVECVTQHGPLGEVLECAAPAAALAGTSPNGPGRGDRAMGALLVCHRRGGGGRGRAGGDTSLGLVRGRPRSSTGARTNCLTNSMPAPGPPASTPTRRPTRCCQRRRASVVPRPPAFRADSRPSANVAKAARPALPSPGHRLHAGGPGRAGRQGPHREADRPRPLAPRRTRQQASRSGRGAGGPGPGPADRPRQKLTPCPRATTYTPCASTGAASNRSAAGPLPALRQRPGHCGVTAPRPRRFRAVNPSSRCAAEVSTGAARPGSGRRSTVVGW